MDDDEPCEEAEDFFAKWGDEGEVDLLDSLSELIVLTASRCLLGREIRETLFSEAGTNHHVHSTHTHMMSCRLKSSSVSISLTTNVCTV